MIMRRVIQEILFSILTISSLWLMVHGFARYNHNDISGVLYANGVSLILIIMAVIVQNKMNSDRDFIVQKMIYLEIKQRKSKQQPVIKRLTDKGNGNG